MNATIQSDHPTAGDAGGSLHRPGSDDGTDCAPYWLCRGMAQMIVAEGRPCQRCGFITCKNTDDCITEWCLPCAAKAWLEGEQAKERPHPNDRTQARRPLSNDKQKGDPGVA